MLLLSTSGRRSSRISQYRGGTWLSAQPHVKGEPDCSNNRILQGPATSRAGNLSYCLSFYFLLSLFTLGVSTFHCQLRIYLSLVCDGIWNWKIVNNCVCHFLTKIPGGLTFITSNNSKCLTGRSNSNHSLHLKQIQWAVLWWGEASYLLGATSWHS